MPQSIDSPAGSRPRPLTAAGLNAAIADAGTFG